jgi:hypothetical protein
MPTLEQDYIMRMINMMVAMMVRILDFKSKRDYPSSLLEIDKTGRTLLGINRTMVRQLTAGQLMQLFGGDQSVAIPKSYVLAVLLHEEGDILRLMSDPDGADESQIKSLNLLLETYLQGGEAVEPRHDELIDEICESFRGRPLPPDLLERLLVCEELRGRYDKAENALFARLESKPDFTLEGIAFYERLLAKSPEALVAGNLPKEEIVEGLSELRGRSRTLPS